MKRKRNQWFSGGSVQQRKLALDELANMSSDLALPILQELSLDQDFALRKIAVMGFGNHPTEESFKLLIQMLETEQDANVLSEAANSLFEFGDRSNRFSRSSSKKTTN